uniref:WW domain-containing protein n=2 Tax=Octactis speculum TaxID=3111310 RepID=A0A7S2ANS2_9STRA
MRGDLASARMACSPPSRVEECPEDITEGGEMLGIAKTSFVRKLYDLVTCESDDIVGFLPDGSSFEVKDPKRLEVEVLPKYFRHSRFQSLVRQLNFYSFKKASKERHMWIYRHELFHRDKPVLLEGLKRKTSQGLQGLLESSNGQRNDPNTASPPEERAVHWREVFDEATGQVYYWNAMTLESQWDPPPANQELVYVDVTRDGMCEGTYDVPAPMTSLGKRVSSAESDYSDCVNDQDEDRCDGATSTSSEGSTVGKSNETSEPWGAPPKRQRLSEESCERTSGKSSRPLHAGSMNRSKGIPVRGGGGIGGKESLVNETGRALPEGDTDAGSISVDSYYSADDSDDSDSVCWEELQVSPEALGSLQRALYERRTSPALVALVTFGLRTTPYQKPSRLLSAVYEKLVSHSELWSDLRTYREALAPKRSCQFTDCEGMYVDKNSEVSDESVSIWDRENYVGSEIFLMREFMAFVVTRLQAVRDLYMDHSFPLELEHKKLLNGCLRLWWKHATRYL